MLEHASIEHEEKCMKPLMIAGIVLVALGAFIMFRGGFSFGTQRSVLTVGDLQVSAEERREVPDWVGGVAILGGLLLIGTGAMQRRGA
jgi:uncharacterized membrane protein